MSGALIEDRTCHRRSCGSPATCRATWSKCPRCGIADVCWYCEPCARSRDNGGKWGCDINNCNGDVKVTELLTGHAAAVARFTETGYIADLEAVRALVTLTEPRDWDVYGSILRWHQKPQPVRLTRPARWVLVAGIIAAICLVTMLTLWPI